MLKKCTPSVQLCWTCRNAVPNPETGQGCEWSRSLKPVPGWKATVSAKAFGTSWSIRKCPKYVAEPERRRPFA